MPPCSSWMLCSVFLHSSFSLHFALDHFLLAFLNSVLERGEGREREGEKHRCGRETALGCLSHISLPGSKPATQACALTGNRTGGLLLCRMMPKQRSHTSQGWIISFSISKFAIVFLCCMFYKHVERILYDIIIFYFQTFHLKPFLVVTIFLLKILTCSCKLSTFFTRFLNTLIVVILKSLSYSSNIWVMYGSGSFDIFMPVSRFVLFVVFVFHCHLPRLLPVNFD